MKKLLLSSVAVCGLALAATPANAQGVELNLGGWFKGYGVFVDQDTASDDPATAGVDESREARDFDILRNTEVHLSGETTLDNGLTVGFHTEAEADNDDSFEVEESYAYFTGSWGRFNVGAENGAAYLLQVEAPSADSNVDGIRQFVDPVNYNLAPGALGLVSLASSLNQINANTRVNFGANGAAGGNDDVRLSTGLNLDTTGSGAAFDAYTFDYDDDITGYANKITYLSPVFSGFQVGVSYTPENDDTVANDERDGVSRDDVAGAYGDSYEIGARYEGQFDMVGVIVGAGFTHSELEADQNLLYVDVDNSGTFNAGDTVQSRRDDRQSFNIGLDLDIGAFGIGAAYVEDDLGVDNGADRETIVVGADYTTGPFKLGASYYNQDQELAGLFGEGVGDLETDRYTGGVVYTYGPGMTFRGSVSYIEHDVPNSTDVEATSVLLGTQINF